jgi:phosphopantetheinyl transferase
MNFGEPIWCGFNTSCVCRKLRSISGEPPWIWQGFAKLRQILSPDQRERADRFHFEMDRRRGVIGRGYLRLLLGRILDLRFEYDEFGKPGLIPKRAPQLQFNLSHSGGLILIAIAMGRAVGVDVERIRTDLDPDQIAARFFQPTNAKSWPRLPVRFDIGHSLPVGRARKRI